MVTVLAIVAAVFAVRPAAEAEGAQARRPQPRRRAPAGRPHRIVAGKPAPGAAPARGAQWSTRSGSSSMRSVPSSQHVDPAPSGDAVEVRQLVGETLPEMVDAYRRIPPHLRNEANAGQDARRAARRKPRQDQHRDRLRHPPARLRRARRPRDQDPLPRLQIRGRRRESWRATDARAGAAPAEQGRGPPAPRSRSHEIADGLPGGATRR